MGVKKIATTVASVVLIGIVLAILASNADSWITDIWNMLKNQMNNWFSIKP